MCLGGRGFLVADTQLYKRLCPSVGPSVGNDRVEKWENELCVYVSVLGGGLGGALGVDGGWLPLPTRPQRYCDPASLVDICARFRALFRYCNRLTNEQGLIVLT